MRTRSPHARTCTHTTTHTHTRTYTHAYIHIQLHNRRNNIKYIHRIKTRIGNNLYAHLSQLASIATRSSAVHPCDKSPSGPPADEVAPEAASLRSQTWGDACKDPLTGAASEITRERAKHQVRQAHDTCRITLRNRVHVFPHAHLTHMGKSTAIEDIIACTPTRRHKTDNVHGRCVRTNSAWSEFDSSTP